MWVDNMSQLLSLFRDVFLNNAFFKQQFIWNANGFITYWLTAYTLLEYSDAIIVLKKTCCKKLVPSGPCGFQEMIIFWCKLYLYHLRLVFNYTICIWRQFNKFGKIIIIRYYLNNIYTLYQQKNNETIWKMRACLECTLVFETVTFWCFTIERGYLIK